MNNFSQTILVVENDDNIRELVVNLLQDEWSDYQIETARDGVEALSKIEGREQALALVLSDINMPGMNGIELFTELRGRDKGLVDLPIVIMSASMNEGMFRQEIMKRGVELEPFSFLPKPFTLDAFIAHVASFLEMQNASVSLIV
jgi:two-component system, cell cycle sensor histidine kinase and response regulator CckA